MFSIHHQSIMPHFLAVFLGSHFDNLSLGPCWQAWGRGRTLDLGELETWIRATASACLSRASSVIKKLLHEMPFRCYICFLSCHSINSQCTNASCKLNEKQEKIYILVIFFNEFVLSNVKCMLLKDNICVVVVLLGCWEEIVEVVEGYFRSSFITGCSRCIFSPTRAHLLLIIAHTRPWLTHLRLTPSHTPLSRLDLLTSIRFAICILNVSGYRTMVWSYIFC